MRELGEEGVEILGAIEVREGVAEARAEDAVERGSVGRGGVAIGESCEARRYAASRANGLR